MQSELYKIFPVKIRELLGGTDLVEEGFTEVRLRCGGPVVLLKGRREFFLHKDGGICLNWEDAYPVSVNEIREMMEFVSNFSVYAYEEELRQGFLTIQGGHRVGICGKTVISEGKIKNIRNISFLNVRLARERKGCGEELIPWLYEGDRLCHTVVVSPPGCGKTTLLRDIIRLVSDGSRGFRGRKVGVVDERSELAACYNGVPQNDLGRRTDVLDGCPKVQGIELLLRSMSPEVIAVDELGGEKDMELIKKSVYCGCTILATVHGTKNRVWPGVQNTQEPGILPAGLFERYIVLKPGDTPGLIEGIYSGDGQEVWKP